MSSDRDVVMIDIREAAELTSRSAETVRRWVWGGRLPAERQGRRLLVAKDDVLRIVGAAPRVPQITLRGWATQDVDQAESPSAQTASDLVIEDRTGRSYVEGGAA